MWKYALIKIDYPDLWEDEGDYCELVEIYKNSDGQYTSFCETHLHSFADIKKAYTDVKRDGINTWFAENGIFSWNSEEKFWDWRKNDEQI